MVKSIAIVLMKPKLSGNVGAIARVMKNFGLSELVLIDPRCDHLSKTARNRAKWANDVLKKAKVRTTKALDKYDTLIATTGKLGSDYNIPRVALTPVEMCDLLKEGAGKTAIIFGPEDRGLLNDEIMMCDIVVSIPTTPQYGILNLSVSVAVLAYELLRNGLTTKGGKDVAYAGPVEKRILESELKKALGKLKFPTKDMRTTQERVWKRIFGKSRMTKRESFAAIGFFKRLINAISKK